MLYASSICFKYNLMYRYCFTFCIQYRNVVTFYTALIQLVKIIIMSLVDLIYRVTGGNNVLCVHDCKTLFNPSVRLQIKRFLFYIILRLPTGIGVTDGINETELKDMVTSPVDKHYFKVADFNNLMEVLENLILGTCAGMTTGATSIATTPSSRE